MDELTASIVMPAFGYIFKQAPNSSYPAFCSVEEIVHGVPTIIEGAGGQIKFTPIVAEHGDIHALGFRMGNVAYLPDMKRITDAASLKSLENLDVLIVDALREINHPAHMSLSESLAFINSVNPRRAILTNMHSDLDYNGLKKRLPDNVEPGFDGMRVTVVAK